MRNKFLELLYGLYSLLVARNLGDERKQMVVGKNMLFNLFSDSEKVLTYMILQVIDS